MAPPIVPNSNVRLVDGPDPWIGRLEVNLVTPTDEWGTVCDDGFDDAAAGVVCSQLNFAGGVISTAARLGLNRAPGGMPILFDDVRCAGSESSVLDCDRASSHNVGLRSGLAPVPAANLVWLTLPPPRLYADVCPPHCQQCGHTEDV